MTNNVTDKRIKSTEYIKRIRNYNKRNYALTVLNWYIEGKSGGLEPNSVGLKYFESQSVRVKLHQIWEE